LVLPAVSKHQGIYTHHLDANVKLTIPRKVNHLGETLSHVLTHHHGNGYDKSKSNQGRWQTQRRAPESTYTLQKIHYHIDVDEETLHLELVPSTASFVAPSMIVERHRRDIRTRVHSTQHINCHYQGQIRGQDHSRVALSACNGLAGMLQTNQTEYWIEPAKNHFQGPNGEHLHVVFSRFNVEETPSKYNSSFSGKKKKRKRKKRHLSNCGTREPRRLAETRLEWQHQGKVLIQGGRKSRYLHDVNEFALGMDTEPKLLRRSKRSVSKPRHVEALVVADHSMVQFHQDVDLQQYLLMIMNMVSSLYKDPTIGNSIQVTVVKIIILEEEDSHVDFNVTHMASNTLENFCRWQKNLNPKPDEDPHHHDVAILVTRKNICSNYDCATLGVANVGGMCRPDKSCSVNEDNGITLAHTISHELGHNFGMYHDTAKTGCDHRIGSILHIMTPSFEADTMQVSWSNCSRRDITQFLDQGLGKCLEDKPSQDEYAYPELPPGAMYNADLQCRLQFNSTDEEMTVCSKLNEICTQLWCLVGGEVCTTMLRPAAPGTNCGRRKWCQNQQCVDVEELPAPVDGGWGDWSPWSECSRHCGYGIAKQTRECDHPSPAYGGAFCIGERARYKTCHVQDCPLETPSFRAEQCSSHNNDTIKGERYSWIPYFDKNEPCELYCSNSEDTMIIPFGNTAADGTLCNIGTNDMCIGGICRKVGCDWVVDSVTTEDRCGVCGGLGDTCSIRKGEITKKINSTDGIIHDVLLIPVGARNVLIEEIAPSKNFIGARRSTGNECYLNCNHFIQLPGEYEVASSLCLYERENEQEKLKIPGPIMEDVNLFIIIKKKNNHVGIRFEYTLPSHNNNNQSIYYWKHTEWSVCTATCGGGKQFRESICHHRGKGVVKDELCLRHAFGKRHETIIRDCNDDPCPFNWWIGPWQLCPLTCRQQPDKPTSIRRRSILCVDSNSNARPDLHCNNKPRPHDSEPCGVDLPPCQDAQRVTGQGAGRYDASQELTNEDLPSELPSQTTPADDDFNNSI
ncbi:A disintegrin and metalloproteinase with thrombospondin motifs 7, partial [Anopheles nili]|uniref:A disintegrin and metalloproteinase with thrombospondin motifs 7 n=1 Tax=Anopheles nili TaxID=185578 RepID=UPI00237A555E